jgi:hypothetical protein
MKVIMQRLAFLLCLIAAATTGLAGAPAVAEVQSVYILPMANGLDQFLANRLNAGKVFRVVTDPQMADALFTDRLGEGFERKYAELYPPPPPPPPPEPPKAEPAKEESKDAAAAKGERPSIGDVKEETTARVSTWGRGKGTIFLVDRKSRAVVWSTYEKPKNTSAGELNRTAGRIVDRLKEELKRQ